MDEFRLTVSEMMRAVVEMARDTDARVWLGKDANLALDVMTGFRIHSALLETCVGMRTLMASNDIAETIKIKLLFHRMDRVKPCVVPMTEEYADQLTGMLDY